MTMIMIVIVIAVVEVELIGHGGLPVGVTVIPSDGSPGGWVQLALRAGARAVVFLTEAPRGAFSAGAFLPAAVLAAIVLAATVFAVAFRAAPFRVGGAGGGSNSGWIDPTGTERPSRMGFR